MPSITVKNKPYEVKRVAGELALLAAIRLDEDLFKSYEKHNEFVEALVTQLESFDPEEIAIKQDDSWVLTLNLEQWFSIISELQLAVYSTLLEDAVESVVPQETLLSEKRILENLAAITVQRNKFLELQEAFDENWSDKIKQGKLLKSPEYYAIVHSHWLKRLKQLDDGCKKFVQNQIAQIPDKFKVG